MLNDFSVLRSATATMEADAPPPGFEDAVLRRIASQGGRRAPWPVHLRWVALAAPAAAVLALAVLAPHSEAPGPPVRVAAQSPVVSATSDTGLLAVAASDPLADLAAANLVERTGEPAGANRDADL